MRKRLLIVPIALGLAAAVFFTLPSVLDRRMNSVESPAPYPASQSLSLIHISEPTDS